MNEASFLSWSLLVLPSVNYETAVERNKMISLLTKRQKGQKERWEKENTSNTTIYGIDTHTYVN